MIKSRWTFYTVLMCFGEVGPTMVGDEHSDPNLMNYLGAIKRNMLGNHFWEYYVNDAPRIVLDKLEKCGYRVISMTGVGQTLVWCLHKEMPENCAFLPSHNIAVNHPA
uniref:GTP cyclohydrolase 1 feedback regulatory protein n=1 Tax=Naja naja TaxID=35670 RepID=A0A8C6VA65_NAJNA